MVQFYPYWCCHHVRFQMKRSPLLLMMCECWVSFRFHQISFLFDQLPQEWPLPIEQRQQKRRSINFRPIHSASFSTPPLSPVSFHVNCYVLIERPLNHWFPVSDKMQRRWQRTVSVNFYVWKIKVGIKSLLRSWILLRQQSLAASKHLKRTMCAVCRIVYLSAIHSARSHCKLWANWKEETTTTAKKKTRNSLKSMFTCVRCVFAFNSHDAIPHAKPICRIMCVKCHYSSSTVQFTKSVLPLSESSHSMCVSRNTRNEVSNVCAREREREGENQQNFE